MSKLVIVESPAKAKTIQKYLGEGYDVVASMGHIRDLPKSKLGIVCRQIELDFAAAREIVLPCGFGGAGRLVIQGLFAPELSTPVRRLRADFLAPDPPST